MVEKLSYSAAPNFRTLDATNLADFKTLNQVIFPVKYADRFYRDCQTPKVNTQLAYIGPKLVGAVASRFELQPDGATKLYIMTLGVYAMYREQNIETLPNYYRRIQPPHAVVLRKALA